MSGDGEVVCCLCCGWCLFCSDDEDENQGLQEECCEVDCGPFCEDMKTMCCCCCILCQKLWRKPSKKSGNVKQEHDLTEFERYDKANEEHQQTNTRIENESEIQAIVNQPISEIN